MEEGRWDTAGFGSPTLFYSTGNGKVKEKLNSKDAQNTQINISH
jgi:hypothetical protein